MRPSWRWRRANPLRREFMLTDGADRLSQQRNGSSARPSRAEATSGWMRRSNAVAVRGLLGKEITLADVGRDAVTGPHT